MGGQLLSTKLKGGASTNHVIRGFPKARRRGGAPRYSTQLTYLNKLTHRHRMRAPDMQAWPFYARACDREAYRNLRMRAIAQR